jgi:ABC-type Na+ efflux pump permease subunit
MKHRDKRVNMALLSSVVVVLVVVIAILYTVATRGTSHDTPDKQPYVVVEETQPTVVQTTEVPTEVTETIETIEETETQSQVVYTEDGVVSISNANNDIYIEGGGNVNVQIDGSVVVSGDGETDGVVVTQDGNANVSIGNIGNGEIVINNN